MNKKRIILNGKEVNVYLEESYGSVFLIVEEMDGSEWTVCELNKDGFLLKFDGLPNDLFVLSGRGYIKTLLG